MLLLLLFCKRESIIMCIPGDLVMLLLLGPSLKRKLYNNYFFSIIDGAKIGWDSHCCDFEKAR